MTQPSPTFGKVFPTLTLTKISVRSQVNVIMSPVNAEAYDYPARIAAECQAVANYYQQPVVLDGKHLNDRHTFHPDGR